MRIFGNVEYEILDVKAEEITEENDELPGQDWSPPEFNGEDNLNLEEIADKLIADKKPDDEVNEVKHEPIFFEDSTHPSVDSEENLLLMDEEKEEIKIKLEENETNQNGMTPKIKMIFKKSYYLLPI